MGAYRRTSRRIPAAASAVARSRGRGTSRTVRPEALHPSPSPVVSAATTSAPAPFDFQRHAPELARRPRRRRRELRVVATLLALGVATASMIAGTSASWFTNTTNPGNAVSSGTLTMTNNKDAASVFSASNIKPGDSGSSTVLVTNTGTVPMAVALTQNALSVSGMEASMRMSLHDDTKNFCYWPDNAAGACSGVGAWDGTSVLTSRAIDGTGAARWAASEAHTFTVSWQLVTASPNSDQGKTASFQLVWDGTI